MIRTISSRVRIMIWGTVCFLTLAAVARSQSADSEYMQQLQLQKDRLLLETEIAKAQKDKAEAEAATFRARLGGLSTTGLPQGTIKADNMVIEASYLGYVAADKAAQVIAAKLGCNENLVFFSTKELEGIQTLDSIKAQIKLVSEGSTALLAPIQLKRISQNALPEPTGGLSDLYYFDSGALRAGLYISAALGAVDVGLSLYALFKTDTEFAGVAPSQDDLALQALVAHHWNAKCPARAVVHPVYSYPHIKTDSKDNELLRELSTLSQKLTNVTLKSRSITDLVKTPLDKAVTELSKLALDRRDTSQRILMLKERMKNASLSPDEKKKVETDLMNTEKHRAELDENLRTNYDTSENLPVAGTEYDDDTVDKFLNTYIDNRFRAYERIQALNLLQTRLSDFVASLNKPDGNGVTPLAVMLRANAFRQLRGEHASMVHTGFVTIGGNNIIKKNAFRSSLRFSGGAIAKYLVSNADGKITSSGVVACHGGQVKEHHIDSLLKQQAGRVICTEEPELTNASSKSAKAAQPDPAPRK